MLKELLPVRASETAMNDAFLALREQMDRVFDDWFNSDFEVVGRVTRESSVFSPRTDVTEDEKTIQVMMELPGMGREDIDVELHPNKLVVFGKKETKTDKMDMKVHRRERYFGTFHREMMLPCTIEETGVKAEFGEGVLTVILPKGTKKETTFGKKIAVR
jgi:HSP20 family protein